jgi:hypothetical protein
VTDANRRGIDAPAAEVNAKLLRLGAAIEPVFVLVKKLKQLIDPLAVLV